MKTIYRTFRYAIIPGKEQQTLLSKHFGCVRYVFNYFLEQRKEQFLASRKSDNYRAQALQLVGLKKREETIWLKEVNSQSLQFALKCFNDEFSLHPYLGIFS